MAMAHFARLTLALITVIVLVVVSGWAPVITPPAGAASPLFDTRSYYIANADGNAARNLGCFNGDKTGRTTLFFGSPVDVGGAYGATLWGGADRTTTQIGELVKEFVRGYVMCRRNPSFQLFVGMGTSNGAIDGKSDAWLLGHGVTWAAVVRSLQDWAATYYPEVIRIYAAWDVEPSWSLPNKANTWMRGYEATPGRRGIHANFSADGCPQNDSANGSCNNGWNQEWLWRLAWRYDPSLPMPQIYSTTGSNARQWQQIDLYGVRGHGDGMAFWGSMSQLSACRQVGGCPGVDNSPRQAHDFLLWYLNSHPDTSQSVMETMTDMNWHR
jgi:hypothetical protein